MLLPHLILLFFIVSNNAKAQIIGSSVVTSVSVVLQPSNNESDVNEAEGTTHPPPIPIVSEDSDIKKQLPTPGALLRKSARKEEGVQNMINTLKNIVQEEQQKHDENALKPTSLKPTLVKPTSTSSTTVQSADESPPTNKFVSGTSFSGEDDDEQESNNMTPAAGSGPATDAAIDDFAKHVVAMQPQPDEADNETATSAEVHDAIHKISGAILSIENEDKINKKPIENIVTDVLTLINTARNESKPVSQPINKPTTAKPKPKSSKTTPKPKVTTQKPISKPNNPSTPKPTTKRPSSSSTTKKPTSSKTTTTLRPKPPQTSQTTLSPSRNQLKTDIDAEVLLKDVAEAMKDKDTNKTPKPSSPPAVELPTIIMLETEMPSSMNKETPSPSKQDEMTIEDKQQMMDKEGMMDKQTESIPETTESQKVPGLPTDDQTKWEEEEQSTEEEQQPVEYTTLRPYVTPPTKSPVNYYVSGPGGKRPVNESTSSNRPNEFYDDEIFGYDPYQTFFHGVYVPVVEVGTLTEKFDSAGDSSQSNEDDPYYEQRPIRPHQNQPNLNHHHHHRPAVKHGKPTKTKKPVPTLPDHLHRPRPSHLQYQHGAADDTDPETGLLNIHYEHPGHSFRPDGESITMDKLNLHSKPPLPNQVRKNFTEHHDHHILHQHGFGGGAGHAGHGGSGSHDTSGGQEHGEHNSNSHLHSEHSSSPVGQEKRPSFLQAPIGNPGLEGTITSLDQEKRQFVDNNNRLALRLLSGLTNPVSKASTSYGNMVISPFTITSSLGMMFLGSRGHTAAQLDGLLRLDDMLTFNPHMMFHNITESFLSQPNTAAAIIRLLVTDKDKGDVLEFYKTRVQHFYEARVEEVDYKFAGHLAQSIINQMIRAQIQRHSYEMLNYSLPLSGPMSLLTAAFFDGQFAAQRDLSVDSMNFIHLAALGGGQKVPSSRRLFQVPAFALKGNLRAAYDKDLDATAVELPYTTRDLSLIAVMPGKPGEFAIGGVSSLKSRLSLDSWTRLMRGFYPRDSFKVILPRFRHQTGVNLSHTLNRFGLTDMFQPNVARFKGINGLTDLHLDQNLMHFAEFGTWEKLSDTLTESNNKNLDLIRFLRPQVREHYGNGGEPMSVNEWIFKSRNPGDQKRSHKDSQPDDVSRLRIELEKLRRRDPHQSQSPQIHGHRRQTSHHSYPRVASSSPNVVEFRPRTLRASLKTRRNKRSSSKVYYFRQDSVESGPEETVLRFERPFLYFLRHNPTGMILMSGQYTEPVTEILE